jgi:hypothetical protein
MERGCRVQESDQLRATVYTAILRFNDHRILQNSVQKCANRFRLD